MVFTVCKIQELRTTQNDSVQSNVVFILSDIQILSDIIFGYYTIPSTIKRNTLIPVIEILPISGLNYFTLRASPHYNLFFMTITKST